MDRWFKRAFEFSIFAYAFFLASRPLSDPDFWFHLKTGEYIINTGKFPTTDIFSFTNYGAPWVAHGWLSGVFFYSIYSHFGFNLLIFLFAVLTALAFWIVFKRCNSHPFIAGLATLLGVFTVLPTIGVRPRVFTLLLSSVYLALLVRYSRDGKGHAVWWLVPLMALWVNLHGAFLYGFALIGVTIGGVVLDAWASGEKIRPLWPRLKTLASVLVGSFLVSLVNPYGLRMWTHVIKVLRAPVFQDTVVDWLSPNFHEPEMLPLALLILLTTAALALSPKRPRPSDLLLFLGTLYATLKANRNLAIFALVAVPLLAEHLQEWLGSFTPRRAFVPNATPSGGAALVLGALLLLPLLPLTVKLKTAVYAQPTQEMMGVPVQAVDYVRVQQITGNTFTDPNIWGGYLIWALPSNPVYIDGRDVYPEAFLKEFLSIIWGLSDWREPFNRYGVEIAIVKPKSVLGRELGESKEWQPIYHDEMAVVFSRRR
jgi:hypothetical protein